MNTWRFAVVIEPDEDVFHAYAPALPGCHTFGATVDDARANIEEAMALHVESMIKAGEVDLGALALGELGLPAIGTTTLFRSPIYLSFVSIPTMMVSVVSENQERNDDAG